MSQIKVLASQLLVAVHLTIGRVRVLARLLDLPGQPGAARVVITRRRQLDYAELFSATDRDGRRAAPVHRSASPGGKRRYRRVDTA